MIKVILAILSLIIVCLNPILSGIFLSAAATRWHAEKTLRRPQEKKKEPAPIINPEKRFTTIKEAQDRNCKRHLKPGFQDDPKWQAQVAELREIMEKNRLIEAEKRANGDWS